jgi:hypothetical protein
MTKYPHKIVSLFEPHTEIIRKGKASKPNEFGKLVQVQEAENQIITHYEVFAERPEDSQLLIPAVEQHQRQFGRAPRMVAADTGFYSLKNEKTIQGMGVTRVAVPSRSTKSSERRKLQSALVQGRAALADRMRGPHQRAEAAPWVESLPLSRIRRYAAVGRSWSCGRQPHSDRPLSRCATRLKFHPPRLGTQTVERQKSNVHAESDGL